MLAIVVITAIMMFCNDGIKTLHEFEQTLGVGGGQRSLAGYSPWGCKKLDTNSVTEHQQQLKGKEILSSRQVYIQQRKKKISYRTT